jgi:hypothetical protein
MQKTSGAKYHAFFQDLMIATNPSSSMNVLPPSEEMQVCVPSKYSRIGTRGAGLKGWGICKHYRVHHAEVMDPGLWRKLPEELVERVFAKLPLPCVVELRNSSKAWYNMSKSANFGKACSKSHPKVFGILGWRPDTCCMRTTLYDIETEEWLSDITLVGSATYGESNLKLILIQIMLITM